MMKNSYRLAAILYVLLFSAALFAREAQLATIEVQNPEQVYRNGDVVELTGTNFEIGESIHQAAMWLYDENRELLGVKKLDYNNLTVESTILQGFLRLSGIPNNASYVNVLLTAELSYVRGTGFLPVIGDDFSEPLSPLGVNGSLTVADQSGDGIASIFENLNLTGSMSGTAISNVAINEYSDASGTTQINSAAPSSTSITFGSGTVGGSVQNFAVYSGATAVIRVVLISNAFDFALSNTLDRPDTQAPNMVTAVATSTTNIRVTFSEDVQADGDPTVRFGLSGADAGGRSISAVNAVGGSPSDTWDLTISSALTNLNPVLTLDYVNSGVSSNSLEDAAGNEVITGNESVTDQIAPSAPTLAEPAGDATYNPDVPLEVNADVSTSSVTFQGSTNGSSWSNLSVSITNNGSGNFTATYTPGTKYAYYRVVASDPSANTANSSSSVQLTDAYRIAITSAETPVLVNETSQFGIEIEDNYGDATPYFFNLGSTYSLSSDGGGTFTSDDAGNNTISQVSISGGNTSASFYYKQATAGDPTITVTEQASNLPVDNASQQIEVQGVTVTGFDLVVNGGSAVTAGSAFSITVTAKNGGVTQENYTGSHTITITGPAADSPDGTSPVLPSNQSVSFALGVGTVTGVTLYNSSETPTLTATDELSTTGTSSNVTVNDASAVEVLVKSSADGEGDYANNVFGSATYQGATQADPDESVQLFAAVYDQYGNLTTASTYSWTGTGDLTEPAAISFNANNVFNPTVSFVGTNNTTYTGTIQVTVNSSFSDVTGTITVDNGIPGQVTSFDASNSNNDEFVVFEWNGSSSGDDGTSGDITNFQIRWADEADGQIDNEAKWDAASSAYSGSSANFSVGIRNVDLSGLPAGNKYFAIRSFDDVGNASPISFTTSTDYSLPVSLTSFQAVAGFGKITLKWETASELNNEGFFIYRSSEENGAFEEPVNQQIISGQGNTNTATTYEYVDENVEEGETYYYKLISRDFDGTIHESTLKASALVLTLPTAFALEQNYPNPFNPSTSFNFTIAQSSTVNLEVYNILGQKVRTLIAGEVLEPGVYDGNYRWDATDDNGNTVSGGIYYYVFSVRENGFRQVRKMVFLK